MPLRGDAMFPISRQPSVRPCRSRMQAGVTLIEMLLVVLLISLMIGVAVPAFQAGLPTIRLRSASSSLAQFLRQASTQVEKDQLAVLLLVDPGNGRLAYRSANGNAAREIVLPDGVEISAIFPAALGAIPGPREFLFYPGGAPPAVAVELSNERGARKTVRLNPITQLPAIEDGAMGNPSAALAP